MTDWPEPRCEESGCLCRDPTMNWRYASALQALACCDPPALIAENASHSPRCGGPTSAWILDELSRDGDRWQSLPTAPAAELDLK